MRKRKPTEESLQISVSTDLKMQYPSVMFTAESSGIRLTMGQAVKAKKLRSERGLPDMMIFEPRGQYHGLIIELKKEGKSPFLLNGDLSVNKHIQEQAKTISKLNRKGYFACFCTGFDSAKETIDAYMKL